jgi:hypothetical protein
VRVYVQDDGLVDDALRLTTDFVSQSFNSLPYFVKVSELLARNFFREHSPGLLHIV